MNEQTPKPPETVGAADLGEASRAGAEGAASKPDPLHGVTLAMMLEKLVDKYGWPGMAKRIRINCFATDPSLASSLTFLRRTPWAREKVQDLYLYAFHGVMKPPSAWTLRGREMRGEGKKGSGGAKGTKPPQPLQPPKPSKPKPDPERPRNPHY